MVILRRKSRWCWYEKGNINQWVHTTMKGGWRNGEGGEGENRRPVVKGVEKGGWKKRPVNRLEEVPVRRRITTKHLGKSHIETRN